ncbi:MAG: serine/threonine-protein kinase, partial [Actinoplanes sp.]
MAVRRMLIAGRYRLHEPVGTGGMGRVWLARDEMLDRDVAVKEFVPPEWMTDDEKARLRTRTLREARSAARLNHPHVVRIYDVVHAENLPWIVMEYVPSRSLHQVIGEDGPFAPADAARIGIDVLEAITAAHRAGVLHRDVKPHNVLIGTDGRVVLTDFGLATFVDDGSVTGPGLIVGSPQYVSPERARDGASTVESDLWSFGATLFAAVEGRSPFARDSAMATLMALATDEPDAPVRAGPLAPVLMGLLRREPIERLTAAEVDDRLRAIVTAAGMVVPSSRANERRAVTLGRAVVPSPRSAPDDEPAPRPQAQAADAAAEPAGGGLGAALAAALPDVVYPPGPERAAEPDPDPHPSAPLIPAQRGEQQASPSRSRAKIAVAGLVLAALAAGGVVVGLVLREDESAQGQEPAVVGAAPSAAPSSAGGFSPVNCTSPPPAGLPVTPLPGAAKMNGKWALFKGWSQFEDPRGFSVAVPDGWTYQTIGTTLCFRDPANIRILSVDPARSPSGDPVAACRKEVTRLTAAGALPGYNELGITPVTSLTRAADWEYSYDGPGGVRLHAITRWMARTDGKAYAVGLMSREFDWPGNFDNWGIVQSSFRTS